MKTVLVTKENIDIIVQNVRNNQVVAFPTETVFGLGVTYGSKEALQKIYALKKREQSKAVTLMVATIEDIAKYGYVDDFARKVITSFMPGKITVILKKQEHVDDFYTAGKDTIGIRIPDDAFVLQLLKIVGPMLVTSANLSGYPDMISEQDVYQVFKEKIPAIVIGPSGSDKASTVVDLSKGKVEILRVGSITKEQIEEVVK